MQGVDRLVKRESGFANFGAKVAPCLWRADPSFMNSGYWIRLCGSEFYELSYWIWLCIKVLKYPTGYVFATMW